MSRHSAQQEYTNAAGHVSLGAGAVRVLMAAGGTGGHVYPALAVAEALRRRSVTDETWRGWDIQFAGTGRGEEARVIGDAGYPFHKVAAAGLKGIGGVKRLRNLALLPWSAFETAELLSSFQPHVVVGVGGYLAGPVMLEAALREIPTLLIEPNAAPGFTNRILAPVVRLAAVGFAQTADYYGGKARVTGHPVRSAFYTLQPKMHVPPFTVLIFGGSQGSAAINKCVVASLDSFPERWLMFHVKHQTGQRDYDEVRDAYHRHGVQAGVYAFIDNMPEAFAAADAVVCRAGANTVAELAAAGKAAILVPLPSAADQHQFENARVLACAGAAKLIPQPELSPRRLIDELSGLVADLHELGRMEERARLYSRPDAAERIADLVEELAAKSL